MQSTIAALRARVLSLGATAADGKNIVAFSGGVDSSLVAALVHQAFPGSSRACVGVSSALPAAQLDLARSVARHIGKRGLFFVSLCVSAVRAGIFFRKYVARTELCLLCDQQDGCGCPL